MTKFYGLSFFSYFFSVVVEAIEETVATINAILVVANLVKSSTYMKGVNFYARK